LKHIDFLFEPADVFCALSFADVEKTQILLGISKMALTKWTANRMFTPSDLAELVEIQRQQDLEAQKQTG
jgi:hypothetical protein